MSAPPGDDRTVLRESVREAILLLTLDHPSGFPRLTREIVGALDREISALAQSAAARGCVITGTDRCFAAGAELAEITALTPVTALEFAAQGQALMWKIERSEKPVVAAIRGHCFGGGLDLALACHVRVAAHDSIFGHRGAALGLLTGWGGTQRMPRSLGPGARAQTLEWLVSAHRITVEEAFDTGLVNRVVPPAQVLETAFALAATRR